MWVLIDDNKIKIRFVNYVKIGVLVLNNIQYTYLRSYGGSGRDVLLAMHLNFLQQTWLCETNLWYFWRIGTGRRPSSYAGCCFGLPLSGLTKDLKYICSTRSNTFWWLYNDEKKIYLTSQIMARGHRYQLHQWLAFASILPGMPASHHLSEQLTFHNT